MMLEDIVLSKKTKPNPKCDLCQGTGIAIYFDMTKMSEVGEGAFELGYLCEHFGGKSICPDCFPFQEDNFKDNELN